MWRKRTLVHWWWESNWYSHSNRYKVISNEVSFWWCFFFFFCLDVISVSSKFLFYLDISMSFMFEVFLQGLLIDDRPLILENVSEKWLESLCLRWCLSPSGLHWKVEGEQVQTFVFKVLFVWAFWSLLWLIPQSPFCK